MGKDRKKSRREDKDVEREHSKTNEAPKEREKEVLKDSENGRRLSTRDRREDIDEHEKGKSRDKVREKEYEKRDKYRDKERDREKDHGREREVEKEHHERGRERKEKERDRDRETERDRGKDREREKHKDRQREKESEREKGKGKDRDIETDRDDKERSGDGERERLSRRNRDDAHDRAKSGRKDEKGPQQDEGEQKNELAMGGTHDSTSEIQERILKMKEERLKRKKPEADSEILAWVSKSRKLEEKKNSEKEKALHLSKVFEEQDNVDQEDSEEEGPIQQIRKSLAGVKVLHGLDKVLEGGAVVLTLKDQNILADGDINQEVDMLENIEIGEQKQRDEAYKAAKKKTGIYEDKFNEEVGFQKKMLPQYDDPIEDEGVTLDESGRFTGEAERKLEELRKRIQGVPTSIRFEDLNSSGKPSSDYFTEEEMLQFKKPKKKKSLRKKEKLDLDALEAEAISAGLGVGDLGSRNEAKMQATKAEQQKSEAQRRGDAYKSAYAKAEEASKALKQEQFSTAQVGQDQSLVFGDDDEDLYKSLAKARKLALRNQDEAKASGPQAVAALAIAATKREAETKSPQDGETQEEKVVFTEMEEFVWGLQNDEEVHSPSVSRAHKSDGGDVFNDKDEVMDSSDQEGKDEGGGWTEVKDTNDGEDHVNEMKEESAPDEIIHEVAVGKGLSGALKLLKDRGTLKETINWGGRNMDKKKSKLVGIYENEGPKESEIRLERLDEFGRVMTPKEAFRNISHKFHGKGPGKMKQEKRMKQYQEELKLKQMKNSDTPSQSMERMREAQALMKTPYLVLSGHVKPGQTSDPRSGFATEDLPGGLTPMLGDRKVEHFLGIKRKADPGSSNMGPPKKPRNKDT